MSDPAELETPARTSRGIPVTDEVVDGLAAEAEAGYDVDAIRGRGRPRMGAAPASVLPVRVEPSLRAGIEARAEAEGTTVSEIVRRAVRGYLARPTRVVTSAGRAGWAVRAVGEAGEATVVPTQAAAIEAARAAVRRLGGGEIVIHGRDGHVRDVEHVRGSPTRAAAPRGAARRRTRGR